MAVGRRTDMNTLATPCFRADRCSESGMEDSLALIGRVWDRSPALAWRLSLPPLRVDRLPGGKAGSDEPTVAALAPSISVVTGTSTHQMLRPETDDQRSDEW